MQRLSRRDQDVSGNQYAPVSISPRAAACNLYFRYDPPNRITDFEYTLDGQLAVLIARNAVTGDQVTRWHYGTTLEENGVASNSLARAKVYPESGDARTEDNGPDAVYDRVEYRYNRLGERDR